MTTTFSTELIGRTEKTLNAILEQHLAGTPLTERHWVALVVTSRGESDGDQLTAQLATAQRIDASSASKLIDDLVAAGLAEVHDSTVSVTQAGRQLFDRIRSEVTAITQRMWGDLPADDLAATGRVLSTILERASAELAGR